MNPIQQHMLETAFSQYGISERVGAKHNPVILDYFKKIDFKWVKTDETAWCSAFANWVCLQNHMERSKKLNARSWLNIGEKVNSPEIMDIVVFWRSSPNSWKGHVGFYVNDDKENVYVLGGNQSNQVCVKPYPKKRFLEYRRVRRVS